MSLAEFDAEGSSIEDDGVPRCTQPPPEPPSAPLQSVDFLKYVDFGPMLLRLLRRRKELQCPIQSVAIKYYRFSEDYVQELKKIVPQVTSIHTLC